MGDPFMKKKLMWEIALYSSDKVLFSIEIPHGSTTDKMIANLLQTLVAKAGLTYEDICDCYTKTNTRRHAIHLDVSTESNKTRFIMSCGLNPYAAAVVKF